MADVEFLFASGRMLAAVAVVVPVLIMELVEYAGTGITLGWLFVVDG